MNNIEEEIKKLDERVSILERKEKNRTIFKIISVIITFLFVILFAAFIVYYFRYLNSFIGGSL